MTAPVQAAGGTPDRRKRIVSARKLALDCLDASLGPEQRGADEAFASHQDLERLAARDRAFARALLATTLRRLGQIDAVVGAWWKYRPRRHRTLAALRLGAAQLLFMGTPPHAAVSETTALAPLPDRGLVNALLRRVAGEGAAVVAAQDEAAMGTPGWLFYAWSDAYGEATARKIAAQHLQEPPLDLSVIDDPAGFAKVTGGAVLGPGTVRIAGSHVVEALPGFKEGRFWVQDVAAALPARLLGKVRGKRVLDLCAAPGGKTAQLASAGARVTAVELKPERAQRLQRNLARLGLDADVVVADAREVSAEQLGRFDAVLVDAPCTATGTIRRHPDILWHKRPFDVPRLVELQGTILAKAADLVGPGGTLVYAVCSLQPDEGAPVVDAFLAAQPAFRRDPIAASETGLPLVPTAAGDLRTTPADLAEIGGMDGFFMARLRRTT